MVLPNFGSQLQNVWNVLTSSMQSFSPNYGRGYLGNPQGNILGYGSDNSIVASLYNRIAMDVSSVDIRHCKTTNTGQYIDDINSGLNNCLTFSPNIDQIPQAFFQELTLTMFDKGCAAVVPIDIDASPPSEDSNTGRFDVLSMRVGKVIEWYPRSVKVDVYNDKTGDHQQIVLPKTMVAIIQNPLYSVMNAPNSNLKRLKRTLALLDDIDTQSANGKMNIIIEFPYTLKTASKQAEAEKRRAQLEQQLKNSKYGVAYSDSTEKIIQLNRPIDNNLSSRVQYLTTQLYSQLGISENILNGNGSEQENINYFNKTIEPIVSAITASMKRSFLTSTAISQGQDVRFYRHPFKLVPVSQLADIADKFTRNEILSSNEFRDIIGYPRIDSSSADELRNKNMTKEDSGYDYTPVDSSNPNPQVDGTEQDLSIQDSPSTDIQPVQ